MMLNLDMLAMATSLASKWNERRIFPQSTSCYFSNCERLQCRLNGNSRTLAEWPMDYQRCQTDKWPQAHFFNYQLSFCSHVWESCTSNFMLLLFLDLKTLGFDTILHLQFLWFIISSLVAAFHLYICGTETNWNLSRWPEGCSA